MNGGNPTLYGYVKDVNNSVDSGGLCIVHALFEMDGQIFKGVNPTDRNPRVKEPIPEL
jgi:hypothetical protein